MEISFTDIKELWHKIVPYWPAWLLGGMSILTYLAQEPIFQNMQQAQQLKAYLALYIPLILVWTGYICTYGGHTIPLSTSYEYTVVWGTSEGNHNTPLRAGVECPHTRQLYLY